MKKVLLIIVIILAGHVNSLHAQPLDFCAGVKRILSEANTSFRTIKDSTLKANEYAIMWASKVNVPGAVSCRIVSAMGIRYEAALFQTRSTDELKEKYDQYKQQLKGCLDNDYKLSSIDNFYPKLGDYKKLIFMRPALADTISTSPAPPHVSMEVDYYKATDSYTIILNIWEH